MISSTRVYSAGKEHQTLLWPFLISLLGHLLLFGYIVLNPNWKSQEPFIQGVIDVQMVNLPESVGSSGQSQSPASALTPEPEKAAPEEIQTPPPQQAPKAEPEISVAPKPVKAKTALKYKTVKPKEVLQKAMQQLEKKVENEASSRQLQDTIKRLKDQVAKDGRPGPGKGTAGSTGGSSEGKTGAFGQGGKQEGDLIDIYRTEIAFEIQRNWAFAEQLAGGGTDLVVSIAFKVLPDGKIEDITVMDRSGNAYLDDSAYKAIVKSSPVRPHPPGMNERYIMVGLRFTPKGVK